MEHRTVRKASSAAGAVEQHLQRKTDGIEQKEAAMLRKASLQELHDAMDEAMMSRREKIDEAADQRDTERLWQLITNSVEQ